MLHFNINYFRKFKNTLDHECLLEKHIRTCMQNSLKREALKILVIADFIVTMATAQNEWLNDIVSPVLP